MQGAAPGIGVANRLWLFSDRLPFKVYHGAPSERGGFAHISFFLCTAHLFRFVTSRLASSSRQVKWPIDCPK